MDLLTMPPMPDLYNLLKISCEIPKKPEASNKGFLKFIPAKSIDKISEPVLFFC